MITTAKPACFLVDLSQIFAPAGRCLIDSSFQLGELTYGEKMLYTVHRLCFSHEVITERVAITPSSSSAGHYNRTVVAGRFHGRER